MPVIATPRPLATLTLFFYHQCADLLPGNLCKWGAGPLRRLAEDPLVLGGELVPAHPSMTSCRRARRRGCCAVDARSSLKTGTFQKSRIVSIESANGAL